MGILTVGRSVVQAGRSAASSAQHAERALSFGSRTRLGRGGPSFQDFGRLPRDAKVVLESLRSVDNYVQNRVIALGMVKDGRAQHLKELAPSKLAGELAAIERSAGKKASTLLSEAAKTKGLSDTGKDALSGLARMLRGGLGNNEELRSAMKLERMKPPPVEGRALSVQEQRAGLEAADRAWAARAPAVRGYDWNWAAGNKPANSPVPLFKR